LKKFVEEYIASFPKKLTEKYEKWTPKIMRNKAKFLNESFMFTGRVGVGKSTLSVAILIAKKMELSYPKRTGKFVDFVSWAESIKTNYSKSNVEVVGLCKYPGCLVLDDLVKSQFEASKNKYLHNVLFTIIDYRYKHELQTIIVSNVPFDEMAAEIGDATASRIRGMCGKRNIIHFKNEEDYRMLEE